MRDTVTTYRRAELAASSPHMALPLSLAEGVRPGANRVREHSPDRGSHRRLTADGRAVLAACRERQTCVGNSHPDASNRADLTDALEDAPGRADDLVRPIPDMDVADHAGAALWRNHSASSPGSGNILPASMVHEPGASVMIPLTDSLGTLAISDSRSITPSRILCFVSSVLPARLPPATKYGVLYRITPFPWESMTLPPGDESRNATCTKCRGAVDKPQWTSVMATATCWRCSKVKEPSGMRQR